ncbi:MAG: hypothetical protein JSV44_06795 [Candidatus Zixiibacteriota bacterium]|nr:MAG: hypothetical protein JSV44_06795 [candidate division Zixibacteria bacterium]
MSSDSKYMEFMQRRIDGELNETESAELDRYLQSNPAAQKTFKSLLLVSDKLAQVGQVEPPEDIRPKVLATIQAKTPVHPRSESYITALQMLWRRGGVRHAASFACGALLGLILFTLYSHDFTASPPDKSLLTGTILFNQDSAEFSLVNQAEFSLATTEGEMRIKRSGNMILAEIAVQSSHASDLILKSDSNYITILGLKQSGHPATGITMASGRIHITQQGQSNYSIAYREIEPGLSKIDLAIYVDSLVFTKSMSIANSGNVPD